MNDSGYATRLLRKLGLVDPKRPMGGSRGHSRLCGLARPFRWPKSLAGVTLSPRERSYETSGVLDVVPGARS